WLDQRSGHSHLGQHPADAVQRRVRDPRQRGGEVWPLAGGHQLRSRPAGQRHRRRSRVACRQRPRDGGQSDHPGQPRDVEGRRRQCAEARVGSRRQRAVRPWWSCTMSRFDPMVELYALGDWKDISSKVRFNDGIRISTGTRELSTNVASSCSMTLDNRTGDFSPRNAMGAYYRLRRNTPIRVGTRIVRDFYTSRSASNGWGTTSQGVPQTWPWAATGGATSDYAVTAGVATHSLSSTASRLSWLPDVNIANIECRVTFQLPFADTLGGSVFVNLLFRGSGGGWYRAQ